MTKTKTESVLVTKTIT